MRHTAAFQLPCAGAQAGRSGGNLHSAAGWRRRQMRICCHRPRWGGRRPALSDPADGACGIIMTRSFITASCVCGATGGCSTKSALTSGCARSAPLPGHADGRPRGACAQWPRAVPARRAASIVLSGWRLHGGRRRMLRDDIAFAKKAGFDFLRIHIKIDDPLLLVLRGHAGDAADGGFPELRRGRRYTFGPAAVSRR